ncbi:hypothetical protein FA15DRAFT_661962 [Coprinopsis marcescibilis]|uniref:Uncharacterized protein n=1 Tax=Coprinopsis marcescibilis TaxID=230819 RepID=A0A5C3K9G7_COPMA|nr:hypothetical protein FA15DRAFT_661962 [Coprinopsis marcescibilis]
MVGNPCALLPLVLILLEAFQQLSLFLLCKLFGALKDALLNGQELDLQSWCQRFNARPFFKRGSGMMRAWLSSSPALPCVFRRDWHAQHHSSPPKPRPAKLYTLRYFQHTHLDWRELNTLHPNLLATSTPTRMHDTARKTQSFPQNGWHNPHFIDEHDCLRQAPMFSVLEDGKKEAPACANQVLRFSQNKYEGFSSVENARVAWRFALENGTWGPVDVKDKARGRVLAQGGLNAHLCSPRCLLPEGAFPLDEYMEKTGAKVLADNSDSDVEEVQGTRGLSLNPVQHPQSIQIVPCSVSAAASPVSQRQAAGSAHPPTAPATPSRRSGVAPLLSPVRLSAPLHWLSLSNGRPSCSSFPSLSTTETSLTTSAMSPSAISQSIRTLQFPGRLKSPPVVHAEWYAVIRGAWPGVWEGQEGLRKAIGEFQDAHLEYQVFTDPGEASKCFASAFMEGLIQQYIDNGSE